MPDRVSSLDVFPQQSYVRFRAHAYEHQAQSYCEPFVPFVGERYGDGSLPRFVYCGVAAWWSEDDRAGDYGTPAADLREYAKALDWTRSFIATGASDSAFWRLFDAVLAVLDREDALDAAERRHCAAWTNLSKLGVAGQSAPPQTDAGLRALDVEQLRHELNVLEPELLLCVSGSNLIPTGNEVFEDWQRTDFSPADERTLVKRRADGGWLYWTMHPQMKNCTWSEGVLRDIAAISAHL